MPTNRTYLTTEPVDIEALRSAAENVEEVTIHVKDEAGYHHDLIHLPRSFYQSPWSGRVISRGGFGGLVTGHAQLEPDGMGLIVTES